jgi:hypothetical protein
VSGLASVHELRRRCNNPEAHGRHRIGFGDSSRFCPGQYDSEPVDPAVAIRRRSEQVAATSVWINSGRELQAALVAVLDMHAPLIHQAYGLICLHCSGWASSSEHNMPLAVQEQHAGYPCATIRTIAENAAYNVSREPAESPA